MKYLSYPVKLVAENHSSCCTEVLSNISKRFVVSNIFADYRSGDRFKKIKEVITDNTAGSIIQSFDERFVCAIESLAADDNLYAECSYIKNLPEYKYFLSSALYIELKAELAKFFAGDADMKKGCWGAQYEPSHITGCRISFPDVFRRDKTFEFILVTDYWEGDGYGSEIIVFTRGKYRSLTLAETSMLAVALSEDFPDWFSPVWQLGISYGESSVLKKYTLYVTPFLVPEYFAPPEPTKEIPLPPVDIY